VAVPILNTKLYRPTRRSEWISRPRLLERLDRALHPGCKFILVSAPAGFGKTTLLAEWLDQANIPAAWLSLDRGDNDGVRFLTYLTAALQTLVPGLGDEALSMLRSPQSPSAETVLTTLLNELAGDRAPGGQEQPSVLVLDDYHEIIDASVHEALAFLLDHLPPQMCLAVVTRVDPPWGLARLRVRQAMIELRARDLRFTPEEATTFFNQAMGLDLSAQEIALLDARTEGWIAGLQMAALALQASPTSASPMFTSPTLVSALIQGFGGTHRFVLDYLVEEVLERQPDPLRLFLLQTSVLSRMSAPLCDALRTDCDVKSQEILTQLERANLFVVPLDDERRWYRYHHLFADLLQSQLRHTCPARVPELYRRASAWCEQNALIGEAVHYALLARDLQRVAQLVAANALSLLYYGELSGLVRSLTNLPSDSAGPEPWLTVARAWAMAYAGQLEEAETSLADLQDLSDALSIQGHTAAVRAYVADLQGKLDESVAWARQAIELLPETERAVRGFVLSLLGTALRDGGDLEAAQRASSEAVSLGRATGDTWVTVTALCELAMLHIWRGAYHRAAALCREAIEAGQAFVQQRGHALPVLALAYSRLSMVHLVWYELADALRYAREAVRLCEPWGQADVSIIVYSRLAGVLAATGELAAACEALDRAKQVAERTSPWYGALLASREASMRLAEGNVAAAARWARECGLRYDDAFVADGERQYITLARVLVAQDRLDQALILLERLQAQAEAAGAIPLIVEALVLRARVLYTQGERNPALAELGHALLLAAPEGAVLSFVHEARRSGLAELLSQVCTAPSARPEAVRHARKVLDLILPDRAPLLETVPTACSLGDPNHDLVEPLTKRELDVLRLLNSPLSSSEIARELYVSVNTVRTHIRNIYAKLGVHRRSQAVDRAQTLGLL
jgi:LuxR family maltose regulon positive regulatory protein